jgi:dTDP-4-amino-4,6-dideoxygalactose transaminase
MIPFNVPPFTGNELMYIKKAVDNHKICGDGEFTKKCSSWLELQLHVKKILLTTSCTSALEMAALLCGINPGDEVIMPSFTFCSTADAFVQRGATIVFVDIRPDTMNIDENKIEAAITSKTKAIVPVHYAGVSCEMDTIIQIAKKYNLFIVEDAAQGVFSTYKGKALGSIGDFGCLSFHETKNLSMGEGGAICLNHEKYFLNAEIIREKGTNRSQFQRGEIDKYTWINYGSSYLPSDLNAAYLWAQLEMAENIQADRIKQYNTYLAAFQNLASEGKIELPFVPENCIANAHLFYIKTKNLEERTAFIDYMKKNNICTPFHYVPLHSAPAGIKYGRFNDIDMYTTKESNRLVRLPLYYHMTEKDQNTVIEKVLEFYA